MLKLCQKEISVKQEPYRRLSSKLLGMIALAALALMPVQLTAQVRAIDPNQAIDADLATPDYDDNFKAPPSNSDSSSDTSVTPYEIPQQGEDYSSPANPDNTTPNGATGVDAVPENDSTTYQDDDLIGAAEGVFGKGAKGLAEVIEDILKKQGRPNAYIAGREASGAFVVGLRYGSGKLFHKVEGERSVYWTGPSVGFDFGGNAANTFVLVYNLYDSEELFRRFPAGEGAAYFIGGFHVSYLRSGDKVLIPVRLGAGLRLGANVGYMKFSKKQNWLPF